MGRTNRNSKDSGIDVKPLRPASTPEGRENQLVALATDLVEKRLREGTASAAETVHFLKIGSIDNRIKRENLKEENKLIRAKAETLESQRKSEELFSAAIKAFKEYSGEEVSEEE